MSMLPHIPVRLRDKLRSDSSNGERFSSWRDVYSSCLFVLLSIHYMIIECVQYDNVMGLEDAALKKRDKWGVSHCPDGLAYKSRAAEIPPSFHTTAGFYHLCILA
jgi:hypothetical protein